MSGRAAALGYRGAWALLRHTPTGPARAGFALTGALATRLNGKGVRRLRSNLARVTGLQGRELDRLTRAGMKSYLRYWQEVFQLPAMDRQEAAARVRFVGAQRLTDVQEQGRGVILALPHMGNWDMAGLWLVENFGTFTTVAERLEPEELFERFVEFRESLGMEILAHRGNERSPAGVLARRLRTGGIVCLLADRDLSEDGVPVMLCGGPTSIPGGPAVLAMRTGAALMPVTMWADPDDPRGWVGEIHSPLDGADPTQLTQALADVFSEAIQAHPEDWHMLGRVWKD